MGETKGIGKGKEKGKGKGKGKKRYGWMDGSAMLAIGSLYI